MDFGIARAISDSSANDRPDQRDPRHRAVLLARAGPRRDRRRPHRPVLHRRRALRAAHRPAAVPRRHRGRRRLPARQRAADRRRAPINPAVSPALNAVVMHALAKDRVRALPERGRVPADLEVAVGRQGARPRTRRRRLQRHPVRRQPELDRRLRGDPAPPRRRRATARRAPRTARRSPGSGAASRSWSSSSSPRCSGSSRLPPAAARRSERRRRDPGRRRPDLRGRRPEARSTPASSRPRSTRRATRCPSDADHLRPIPQAGTRVGPGDDDRRCVVSSGPPTGRPSPAWSTSPRPTRKAAITAAGLVYGATTTDLLAERAGRAGHRRAGARGRRPADRRQPCRSRKGSTVNLVVSNGLVQMPDVTRSGRSSRAQTPLSRLRAAADGEAASPDTGCTGQTVTGQSPSRATQPQKSTVTLTYCNG